MAAYKAGGVVNPFAESAGGVPVLAGVRVRLEPLTLAHAGDLRVAAEEDRDTYGFTVVPRAATVEEYIAGLAALRDNGAVVAFAQVRCDDGRAIGATSLCEPRYWPGRDELCAVEIGRTWLAASAQRTGINAEAKFLMFEYAFETLRVARVDLKTDARNERSRRAIVGIGATFEGVLRQWSPSWVPGEEGQLRDSALFSVTAAEWPDVKSAQRLRLGRASAHR
jgi:RimJ/RimL family protein N-acetyltransferase